MSTTSKTQVVHELDPLHILWMALVDAAFPFALYVLVKSQFSSSELAALSAAVLPPALVNASTIARRCHLDVIGVIVLVGLLVSIVGVMLGGDPKILLIRESFVTGALGLLCFLSLCLPHPLLFYFARQFKAGTDPVKIPAACGLAPFSAHTPDPDQVIHRRSVFN